MTKRQLIAGVFAIAGVLVVTALIVLYLPRWQATPTSAAAKPAVAQAPAVLSQPTGRKIKAHLYYINDEGTGLTSVERDVAYGETPADQAREIVLAQIAPAGEPLVSAIPNGTALRALFLTDKGEAFVDFSRDLASSHPGGTLDELLTVYAIVNVLATNMPAVHSVQLLVDGKEVDTLAGHVDLRRPLVKNLDWVQ
jgi:spore germination protein GerM